MAKTEVCVELKLNPLSFARLLDVVIHVTSAENIVDSLYTRLIEVTPDVITSLLYQREGVTISTPMRLSEIRIVHGFLSEGESLEKLLQEALDTAEVYLVTKEIENDLRDGDNAS